MGMDSLEKQATPCPVYKPCNTRESTHCHILEIAHHLITRSVLQVTGTSYETGASGTPWSTLGEG